MGSRSSSDDDGRSRQVTVPLRTYKAVTVFSTLVAIVAVIIGFGFLDAATASVGPLAVLLDQVVPATDSGAFALVSALVGLAFVGFGAGTYVLGTRFRTEGMGKAQDDGGEGSDNE